MKNQSVRLYATILLAAFIGAPGCTPEPVPTPVQAKVDPAPAAPIAPVEVARVWTQEPDAFMGWRFGSNIKNAVPICPKPGTAGTPPPCLIELESVFQIRDVPGIFFTTFVGQVDDGLEEVLGLFKSHNYADVLATFIERYGKPDTSVIEPWRSKGGAVTTSATSTWKGKNIHISLSERSSQIDEGSALYTTEVWRIREKATQTERVTTGAKNL